MYSSYRVDIASTGGRVSIFEIHMGPEVKQCDINIMSFPPQRRVERRNQGDEDLPVFSRLTVHNFQPHICDPQRGKKARTLPLRQSRGQLSLREGNGSHFCFRLPTFYINSSSSKRKMTTQSCPRIVSGSYTFLVLMSTRSIRTLTDRPPGSKSRKVAHRMRLC